MYYLLKTEPSDYNISQLAEDKQCTWDGVANALALIHLRKIKKGDMCFIYHTGKEKQIVGLSEAISDPFEEEGMSVIKLKFLKKYSVTLSLSEIKNNKVFQGFDLLRLARLSVMPVPEPYLKEILKVVK